MLPRWIRVSNVLDYVAGIHPRFDRAKAEAFLTKTTIKRRSKVRELSKGMVTQLHLAIVMAIDAKLLILDEPTLGLDILVRKQFYDSLLNDYFDRSRTIVVTTHQVEEIQDVLTDVMFIDRGRIVFESRMEDFESRYVELMVNPDHLGRFRRVDGVVLAGGLHALAADHQIVLAAQLFAHFRDGLAHAAGVLFIAVIGQRLVDERACGGSLSDGCHRMQGFQKLRLTRLRLYYTLA